ncbi:GntR family transcriptional regulator [Flavobacterium luteolum]|uniref:GntR family transcriptional regulator n=1 Tax=Flavobacterium luteolum TaxID=3003259 RepID=UPI00248D8367|nr:substrate-binding domain-containing protein [Flavobacterium luteolum]
MNILTDFSLGGSNRPKYLQIADCFIDNISRGNLKNNQRIPSINEFSKAYNCSRDTVEKGYKVLKERNAIKVIKGKGTYIDSTKFVASRNVLFLINKLSTYKLEMYNSFCDNVDSGFQNDFEIYNCDEVLFRNLLDRNFNLYDYYIIMPHFKIYNGDPNNFSSETIEIIKSIPEEKLVIMDNNELKIDGSIIEIYQDFSLDVYEALSEGIDKIRKYKSVILVTGGLSVYSYMDKIKKGFIEFCQDHKLHYEVLEENEDTIAVERGDLFITVNDTDLVKIIDAANAEKFELGADIGVISYNETPLKRLLGIAVMSTDFKGMGATAASMILNNEKGRIRNPFKFIDRVSL